jgi:uncharacterized protein
MIFVDSSAWFAAMNRRDRHHQRAVELLSTHAPLVTSLLVIVETWLLINSRIAFETADQFIRGVGDGNCEILPITSDDWLQAPAIAERFSDQTFSLVDRLSFAAMERNDVARTISFDSDFVIYRYGQNLMKAFEVFR